MTSSSNSSSVFPYPGGKGSQSEWIVDRIPPHDTFIEMFGGSGAITYNKPPSKYEIYNDINDDLVQFFEVLRTRTDDLVDWLRAVPYARSLYENWVHEFYDGYRPEDPVARAGRFFALRYMQTQGEASKPNGMKTRAKRSPARTFDNAREQLYEVADRFRQVTIENKHYADLLEDYDDPDVDVLVYGDAPYIDTEHYYGVDFDHAAFVDTLADLDAEWMVAYDELPPGLADIGYVLKRSRRHRMRQSDDNDDKTEYLVCSFDPESTPGFVGDSMTQTRFGEVVNDVE